MNTLARKYSCSLVVLVLSTAFLTSVNADSSQRANSNLTEWVHALAIGKIQVSNREETTILKNLEQVKTELARLETAAQNSSAAAQLLDEVDALYSDLAVDKISTFTRFHAQVMCERIVQWNRELENRSSFKGNDVMSPEIIKGTLKLNESMLRVLNASNFERTALEEVKGWWDTRPTHVKRSIIGGGVALVVLGGYLVVKSVRGNSSGNSKGKATLSKTGDASGRQNDGSSQLPSGGKPTGVAPSQAVGELFAKRSVEIKSDAEARVTRHVKQASSVVPPVDEQGSVLPLADYSELFKQAEELIRAVLAEKKEAGCRGLSPAMHYIARLKAEANGAVEEYVEGADRYQCVKGLGDIIHEIDAL